MKLEFGSLVKNAGKKELNKLVYLIDARYKNKLKLVRLPLVEALVRMNARNWGSKKHAGNKIQIKSRLRVFPEGQLGAFVKVQGKKVLVGSLHTLRTNHIPSDYITATSQLTFKNHRPKGRFLLCVSIVGDKFVKNFPQFKEFRVAQQLLGYGIAQGLKQGLRVIPYSRVSAVPLHAKETPFKPKARELKRIPRATQDGKTSVIFEYKKDDFQAWQKNKPKKARKPLRRRLPR